MLAFFYSFVIYICEKFGSENILSLRVSIHFSSFCFRTSAASVRQNKVSGIRNKAKNHVASIISEDSRRMSVKVIQKLVTSGFS